jgi:DNA-binding phage protein
LCPVAPILDEFALTGFLLIQALTERHNPSFAIVIPVVVALSADLSARRGRS